MRERIIIDSINCTFEGRDNVNIDINPDISLGDSEEQEITCASTDSSILNMKGKMRATFSINYIQRDGLFYHEVQGTAFSQVVLP